MITLILIIVSIFVIIYFMKTRTNKENSDEFGVYLDGNGDYRLVTDKNNYTQVEFGNHKKVYYSTNDFGEKVIKDVKNGLEIINCDLVKAKKNEEEAIKNGNKFFVRCDNPNSLLGTRVDYPEKGVRYGKVGEYYGQTFVESNGKFKFAKLYVERTIRKDDYSGKYFMKLGSYLFDSPTDETRKQDILKYGEDKAKEIETSILEEANKKLNEIYKDKTSYNMPFYIPKHDTDFCLGTNYSYICVANKIKNW